MQLVLRACLRALPSAGRRIEISSAMMPMTTRSSTSVKAARRVGRLRMNVSECEGANEEPRDVNCNAARSSDAGILNGPAWRAHVILRGTSEVFHRVGAREGGSMAAEEQDVEEDADGVDGGHERDFSDRAADGLGEAVKRRVDPREHADQDGIAGIFGGLR